MTVSAERSSLGAVDPGAGCLLSIGRTTAWRANVVALFVGTLLIVGLPAQMAIGAESGATELEEVVVTAERHSESIEKAPYAIAAVSASELEARGVTSGAQIADLVPGVKLSTERGSMMVFIRGIGSVGGNPYTNPDVVFNLDGQALALPTGPNGAFYDLARVEVLKGPQGTLYGRNAAAGAVNVISNNPSQSNEASGEVQAGNYGLFRSTGMINMPISSDFAVRAAFQSVRHSGYISGGPDANDADDVAGRIKALWKPSDDISLLLGADYYHQGGKGSQRVPMNTAGVYYSAPWSVPEFYPLPGGGVTDLVPNDSYTNNRNTGVWAELNVNVGIGTLTVLPAYRAMTQDVFTRDLGFGFLQKINDRSTSLEVRLASKDAPGSRIKWVAGLFNLDESLPNHVEVQQSFPAVGSGIPEGLQTTDAPSQDTKSYAAFFQTTLSATDKLRFTAGVRYTHDSKSEHAFTVNDNPNGIPGGTGTFSSDFSIAANKTTWRAGVDFDAGPNSIVYANASTGYKVGGFGAFPDATATAPASKYATYGPEDVRAYDIGTKNVLLNHRLILNAEAFYYIYVNQQVNTIFLFDQSQCCGGSGAAITPSSVNAGHGTDKGIDLELTYQATDKDRISTSVEYLDTQYQTFVYPFLFWSNDNSGKPFNYAPKFSGNLGYTHMWDAGNGGTVTAALNTHVTTNYWVDYNYTPGSGLQAGYTRSDLDVTYASQGSKWHVGAWVRNIENRVVKSFVGGDLPGSPNGTDGQGMKWAELDAPRTYGVTFGARF